MSDPTTSPAKPDETPAEKRMKAMREKLKKARDALAAAEKAIVTEEREQVDQRGRAALATAFQALDLTHRDLALQSILNGLPKEHPSRSEINAWVAMLTAPVPVGDSQNSEREKAPTAPPVPELRADQGDKNAPEVALVGQSKQS